MIYEKKGQLKKIFVIIFLVLLVAIGIITAQNIVNESENEKEIEKARGGIISSQLIENNNLMNDSEIKTPDTETNNTTNLCAGMFCNVSTTICPDSFIATCENFCILETGTCNICIPDCTGHEQNITNETQGNITIPPTDEGNETLILPNLEIQLSYPSKITRGEIIEIEATIKNSGAKAKKVTAEWILPQDFEIISGSLIENCGNLNTEESCTSAINIQTSFSTSLGKNQIKISVSYEK